MSAIDTTKRNLISLPYFVDEDNWGPQPICMSKCSEDLPGYKEFVIDKWQSNQLEGWGSFTLEEKLRIL